MRAGIIQMIEYRGKRIAENLWLPDQRRQIDVGTVSTRRTMIRTARECVDRCYNPWGWSLPPIVMNRILQRLGSIGGVVAKPAHVEGDVLHGRGLGRSGGLGILSSRRGSRLQQQTQIPSEAGEDVGGCWIESFTHHNSHPRGAGRVGEPGDSRDHGSVAGEWLGDKLEGIGGRGEIVARRRDTEHAVGMRGHPAG
jgi:hypothetical protein